MSDPEDIVTGGDDNSHSTASTGNTNDVGDAIGTLLQSAGIESSDAKQMVTSGIEKIGVKNIALFGGVALILASQLIPNKPNSNS